MLTLKYIGVSGDEIVPEMFDDDWGLEYIARPVPNTNPIPLEELEELFEQDVEEMTTDMLKNFENREMGLTIQQVDALVLLRFNTGHLGPDITSMVENGATKEEWDKYIDSHFTRRRLAVGKIFWGNVMTYEDKECLP